MPLVRVVIPTFNRAANVCAAIETVRQQTFTDFEVVVADDGSTDDTLERLRFVTRSDPRVRVLALPHGGAAAARNAALAERGDYTYVAFLDSDDRWQPDHLDAAVAILDARPAVALVFGAFDTEDETGTWTASEMQSRRERVKRPVGLSVERYGRVAHILDPERVLAALLRDDFQPATPTVVVRASSVAAKPWFDASMVIMEDSDFYLRLAATRQWWAFIDQTQCTVRFLGDNLTRSRDLASPVTLERLRCDLRFSRRRLEFCANESDRAAARRIIASRAYSVGQSCAEQGDFQAARAAYWESLTARPGYLAAKGIVGTYVPDRIRAGIQSRRRRSLCDD